MGATSGVQAVRIEWIQREGSDPSRCVVNRTRNRGQNRRVAKKVEKKSNFIGHGMKRVEIAENAVFSRARWLFSVRRADLTACQGIAGARAKRLRFSRKRLIG